MSKFLWVIDMGHGGINKEGVYETPGKKQYHFESNGEVYFSIYEGDINRKIGHKLAKKLKNNDIEYKILTPGSKDYSLGTRVRLANDIYAKDKRAIYLSLHSNAVSPTIKGEGSKATGYEIFTSKGQTKSDAIAEIFMQTYKVYFDNVLRARTDTSDGDLDKEADFYVLRKTAMPAILVENLFYDNIEEAKYLSSNQGQREISNALLQAIKNVEQQL